MQHAAGNARALPKSVAGKRDAGAEPECPAAPQPHADRATLVLSDNPRWIAGSDHAEVKHTVALALRDRFPDSVHLYNRRVLGGPNEAVIDILLVSRTGVWLIEVEDGAGSTIELAEKSGWRGPYARFLVNREDYTPIIHSIDRRSAHVRGGLAAAGRNDVSVEAVMCLVGAHLGKQGHVGGTFVTGLSRLHRGIKGGSMRLSAADVASLGLVCGERFRRPRRDL